MAKYQDIPTLKEEIDHATVDSVLELDVDQYKYGFESDIPSDVAPAGLSEDTIRFISKKKNEPQWMLDWRLEAYRRWLTMTEPNWAKVKYPKIDMQDMSFYAAPKSTSGDTATRSGAWRARNASREPAAGMDRSLAASARSHTRRSGAGTDGSQSSQPNAAGSDLRFMRVRSAEAFEYRESR